ncbi:MAG: PAC2 family protein [Dehalogenimonas sp.]|uniref:PAC2 family protein n=1 Tax=Candidatus Dehalogenimonas loeffleri TaxID=3127115 RepID=A0ABZ2J5P9_9CHLR|nr:PAC2 family protein [Dehalogenimonas sp.]
MKGSVKILARPKLKDPYMLAAWPGIANVALIVGTFLAHKLNPKPLAEVIAPYFFDPIGVLVQNNLVESPQFPESRFFYWKNKPGKRDLILFIGDDQPQNKTYELAHSVIDVAERFGVKRLYTCAAALTRIHHSEQPKVWGAATQPALLEEIKQYDLVLGGDLQISGLNGLLLGVAKDRRLDAMCLLGEVPHYASRFPNPTAALAITEVLLKMLDVDVELDELKEQAVEASSRLKEMAAEAMGDYIDYFTEPIWESGGEYGDEEEDDEAGSQN